MKKLIKSTLTLFVIFSSHLIFAQIVTNHNALFQGNIPIPQVGLTYTDAKFGTDVKRITDARSIGKPGLFPEYSKRQAWNSDETRMMLRSADGSVDIYNGQTYQFIQTLSSIEGVEDIFWHPTNPQVIYYISENIFNSMNVQTLQTDQLYTFTNYVLVTTRGEGNMSNDGHYIALCGYDASFIPLDFLVFDISSNSIHSTLPLNGNVGDFDWISISPNGNYVIVDYATDTLAPYNGVEVYDNNLNFIWRKPLGFGHSDCGLDTNGDEVLIMDVYDGDSNLTYINKYRLANGISTTLLSVSPEFDMHESCRAMSRPGWVYVSTFDFTGRLTDDSLSCLPFEDEIFALKMDGSGDVQRYAHHHSRRYSPGTPNSDSSVYFSEPHATVNKTGTHILFGSNWRINMEQDTSVDAYVVDLSNLLSINNNNSFSSEKTFFKIYPNPVNDKLNILSINSIKETDIRIYNTIGEMVKESLMNKDLTTLNVSDLSKGFYFYQITDRSGKLLDTGKFMKE